MDYISLYRKYRPINFEEIVGQDNITRILKNQVKNNKISHAYLFSGTRGTGKTSSAKVFARAINCLNNKNGEPCNECEACSSILNKDTTDIVEMDAASNNSVEDIRQIRNEVVYASTSLKYKVYIIDEVHMLSTSAFNALLKTLEEPPKNVVFILATTEKHKIPVTILSRCLRFDFSKLPENVIKNHVKNILEKEKVKYDEESANYIAKLADGALRDALSILERCLSENNEEINISRIRDIIGSIDEDILQKLVDNILNSNSIEIISNIDLVLDKGKDLRNLVYELTSKFLDILVETKDKKKISSIITELSKLDNAIRYSMRPDILIKASLIRIANLKENINNNEKSNNTENVINYDLETIEKRIINLENNLINLNRSSSKVIKKDINEENNNTKIDKRYIKYKDFEKVKNDLAKTGNLKIYSALSNAEMYCSNDDILFKTNNEFAYKIISSEMENIKMCFKQYETLPEDICLELKDETNENKMEKLLNNNNIDYINLD